ncbi:hypothetical protein PHMEG_00033240 [Phytophthora megakarya]|uniref:DDE-1 domain-containing protein n=1 Tax=Phytophthora megakarya TaxID=4795 RepID=A0A225UTZ5_9STRA|nr:hypothetical protein PHMEG_00033240 [Phytophthora megakarya]
MGVNYEYIPATIVNANGVKTVWVKSAGKTKERVTAMLLGGSDGNKAEPFLVFKTRPSKLAAKARQNTICHHGFGSKLWSELKGQQIGVQIYGNRAGWWNSELSIEFLYYHFKKRSNMHEPCPLVRVAGAASAFKMIPPSRTNVINWIKSAWASLNVTTIFGGFKKTRVTKLPELSPALVESPVVEPDWGSLVRLLQPYVPFEEIDTTKDIDQVEIEGEIMLSKG